MSSAQREPEALQRPWSGRLLRAKWRLPTGPPGAVSRPRIIDRLSDPRPFALIVAPAGFGKTITAVEWASCGPAAAWLTADAADASLHRFWAHMRAALAEAMPGFGELVNASLEVPHRASAADLGRILGDELLDVTVPVRLVIDDLHLIPESETHGFLAGLLETAPAGFKLVATARSEPPLPLTRMRMRGVMTDIRGVDLLFTEDETRALVAQASPNDPDRDVDARAAALWQRTRGWAAGLRLGALAFESQATSEALLAAADTADSHLLAALLEETMAGRSPDERELLLRAALADRFTVQFAAALGDGVAAGDAARDAVRFALAADLCRPSGRLRGDWLEFHPLFLTALRQRLAAEESEAGLGALHARAALWFETAGLLDPAITHWLAAGETDNAIALVEQELEPAFAREDWPAIARWLGLLPSDILDERPEFLLARGWLAHLRGQAQLLGELLQTLERRLAHGDLAAGDVERIQAETALMTLSSTVPIQIDPDRSVAIARNAIATMPQTRRFRRGFATTVLGMGLASSGRHGEAVAELTTWTESSLDQVDAGSIRGLLGLLFVHSQAGELAELTDTAGAALDLAERHHLRLSAGWARRFLGDAAYERNDLDLAMAQYGAVATDYEYCHLTGVREALFGLALTFVASGRPEDAQRTMRRTHEIMAEAKAIEQLPTIAACEAWLAFRGGDLERALGWARAHEAGLYEWPLYMLVHPTVVRAAVLCSGGDNDELVTGVALLAEARRCAAAAHFDAALVRIDALLALAHLKRGDRKAAIAALHRSVAIGARKGFCRVYLDLAPAFTKELRELTAIVTLPRALHGTFQAIAPVPGATSDVTTNGRIGRHASDRLSEREIEILEFLARRFTYKEIADHLYISPLTVKRHASTIYSKLGATGRDDAVRIAQRLGWTS